MSDKENIVLTQDEIDKITNLIKSGKTLKEIGETITPPKRRRRSKYDIEMAEAEARAKYSQPIIATPAPVDKVEVIVQQAPTVDVKVDILVDNKRISLGATRVLEPKQRLLDAHEQLYAEIILSMENLVSIVNESKK